MVHLLSTTQKTIIIEEIERLIREANPFSLAELCQSLLENESFPPIKRTLSSGTDHPKPWLVIEEFLMIRWRRMDEWACTISPSLGPVFFKIAKNSKAGKFLSGVPESDPEQPQSLPQYPSIEDPHQ
jgi:hypothetical protein